MMDLLNLNRPKPEDIIAHSYTQPVKNSRPQTRNCSTSNLNKSQQKTISSRQHSQHSSRKNTIEAGYHEIAYQDQIKKNKIALKKKRSVSSSSSTSSMSQSFLKMEQKMKKFSQKAPEIVDQKYMIQGYQQLSKEYKNLVFTVLKFGQDLNAVIQFGSNNLQEDKILKVDQFFEKHSNLLKTKIQDYFKIKECLYRFLRMQIQEPYYHRVQKKIHLIEKQNQIFQTFQTYLEAYDFINYGGFDCFADDIQIVQSLKQPPTTEKIGLLFTEKIQVLRQQILGTRDLKEGLILSQIFEHKIEQVYEWKNLIIKLINFQYIFNLRYQLNSDSYYKKLFKSKKLYAQLFQHLNEADQFQISNFTIGKIYQDQIAKIKNDLEAMKQQIIDWNIKLRDDQFCNTMLKLVKTNINLKKANQTLDSILQLSKTQDFNQQHEALATDIIIKVKQQLKLIASIVTQIKQGSQIKKDEYIKTQYNKFMLLSKEFQLLKQEFEV